MPLLPPSMLRRPRILVVEDRESIRTLLETILESYEITAADSGPAAALALMEQGPFEVVLTDVRLPGADGHEVLRTVKAVSPDTQVVIITAYATVPDAVAAMREGAFDYMEKPFDPDDVSLVVARAVEEHRRRVSEVVRRIEAGSGGPAHPGEGKAPLLSMTYREATEAGHARASRSYLVALMREFDGRVTLAAARAGMERESLHRLLRRYQIRTRDFRPSSPGFGGFEPWASTAE